MEPAGEHFLPAAGTLTGSRPAVEIARKGQVGAAGLRVLGDLIDAPAGGEGPVHLGIAGGRGGAYAAGGTPSGVVPSSAPSSCQKESSLASPSSRRPEALSLSGKRIWSFRSSRSDWKGWKPWPD